MPFDSLAMHIILASTSPRRQALLALADIDFTTLKIDTNEERCDHESATAYIKRMINNKTCQAIAILQNNCPTCDYQLIITADTIGVIGDDILTKPMDKQHAFAMWQALSDNTHSVWTAVQATLLDRSAKQIIWQDSTTDKTDVTFIKLSQTMMEDYWQTGEPIDKAGAYAIQGRGACFVKAICGNYTNVVGLPLPSVMTLINTAKNHIPNKIAQ